MLRSLVRVRYPYRRGRNVGDSGPRPRELHRGREGRASPGRCRGLARVRQPHRPRDALAWRGSLGPRERRRDRSAALGGAGGARRVAPGGMAYGVDMTDEMLALAEKNKAEAGVENAEFLKGNIEEVPLPDEHVDVVISNCVINLSTDKPSVISEAYRVLKPGGRFAVSDVVFLGSKAELPEEVLETVGLWTGCVVGALEKEEYEALLTEAGLEDISVEVQNVYAPEAIDGLAGPEEI